MFQYCYTDTLARQALVFMQSCRHEAFKSHPATSIPARMPHTSSEEGKNISSSNSISTMRTHTQLQNLYAISRKKAMHNCVMLISTAMRTSPTHHNRFMACTAYSHNDKLHSKTGKEPQLSKLGVSKHADERHMRCHVTLCDVKRCIAACACDDLLYVQTPLLVTFHFCEE